MEINPNRSVPRLNKPVTRKAVSRPGESRETSGPDDDVHITGSVSNLEEVLAAMPEERPERLEEGHQLKRDPDYPTDRELRDLGSLVVQNEQKKFNPNDNPEADHP